MSYVTIPGMQKKLVIKMDDRTFEKLIKQEIPKLVNVPDIDEYEFVAHEESGNDVSHSFNASGLYKYYQDKENPFEYEIKQWESGNLHYQAGNFVHFLVYKGVLEPAEYIVSVSW